MSVVWRLLSVAALLVSAGILLLAIRSVRKEQRVRPGLDLARLGITMGTTLAMGRLLGVATAEVYMGLGFLVGLLLGLYEGLHLRLRFLGRTAFARRTALGVGAWGLGVLLVQVAGIVDRAGAADLGLALSFLGIGQVVGVLTGRWEKVMATRGAAAGAGIAALVVLALAGSLWPGSGAPAEAQAPVDLRAVMAGQVRGLTAEVRGNSQFYGPALSIGFSNGTGADAAVAVPLGLQFIPEIQSVQTMIAAGGETIVVPAVGAERWYTVPIQAFCGQFHDSIPNRDDVFSAGEPVTGDLAALIALIHRGGVYGYDQQRAVWALTDGIDTSEHPVAADLVDAVTQTTHESDVPEGGGQTGLGRPLPVAAVDDDPENRLWACASNPAHRVGFGDATEDRVRCFSFRYDVPPEGISSAVVYLAIEAPLGSLQATDSVAVAVGEAFPGQCDLNGEMPGCVTLHRGFAGGERSLTLDLLDPTCAGERHAAGGEPAGDLEEAIRAQLATGVLHMILQDDTTLHGARLALNEGPPLLSCGTSAEAAPLTGGLRDGSDEVSPVEGARTSLAGLGGAAALLLSALAGSSQSLASVGAALRSGGGPGLREALRGGSPGNGGAVPWFEPQAALAGGRAQEALAQVPEDLRLQVQEVLAGRLEDEQVQGLLEAIYEAAGPIGPDSDPAALLAADRRTSALLHGLPHEARRRLEEKLLAGLQETQVAGAAEEATRALRRDRATGLLRAAIGRRDGPGVQAVLAALGEEDAARAWPRAVAGMDFRPDHLEYPPPAPGGGSAAGLAAPDLGGFGDAEADLTAALVPGGEAEGLLSRLPGGLRSRVEARLSEKLEAGRVSRWVDQLRGGGGSGGGMPAPAGPPPLLGSLAPGIREQVAAAAAELAEGRTVDSLAGTARQLLEEDGGGDLMARLGGWAGVDRSDAIQEAVDAALEAGDEADLERLVRRPRPAGAISEEALLAAARRVGKVEELLQQAGELRPRVEAALVGRLQADRLEAAVTRVGAAVRLDRAEAALRQAAAAGDLGAADRALAGLTAEQARLVGAAVFGG